MAVLETYSALESKLILSAILFILAIVLAVKGAKTIFRKKDKPQAA